QSLDTVSSLVDKSLVIKEDVSGLACYRLHETMREFARLKWRDGGEEAAVEDRTTEYYRSSCRQSVEQSRYRLAEWLQRMGLGMGNTRAVLGRCLSVCDSSNGLDLATAIGWYWITRATTEGVHWLDNLLACGRG